MEPRIVFMVGGEASAIAGFGLFSPLIDTVEEDESEGHIDWKFSFRVDHATKNWPAGPAIARSLNIPKKRDQHFRYENRIYFLENQKLYPLRCHLLLIEHATGYNRAVRSQAGRGNESN